MNKTTTSKIIRSNSINQLCKIKLIEIVSIRLCIVTTSVIQCCTQLYTKLTKSEQIGWLPIIKDTINVKKWIRNKADWLTKEIRNKNRIIITSKQKCFEPLFEPRSLLSCMISAGYSRVYNSACYWPMIFMTFLVSHLTRSQISCYRRSLPRSQICHRRVGH